MFYFLNVRFYFLVSTLRLLLPQFDFTGATANAGNFSQISESVSEILLYTITQNQTKILSR